MHTSRREYPCMHPCIHPCMQPCMHLRMHPCMHSGMHVHTNRILQLLHSAAHAHLCVCVFDMRSNMMACSMIHSC